MPTHHVTQQTRSIARGPHGVWSEWVNVTKEMAANWLKQNVRNRRVRPAHLEKICRDLRNGRLQMTHQGIAFDSNRKILDGQHRLLAIVETGIPTWLLVTHNLPNAVREVIDDVSTRAMKDHRKFSDRLGLGELPDGHAVDATAYAMITGTSSAKGRKTTSEVLDFEEKYHDGLAFASEMFGSWRLNRVNVAGVRAAVARAFYVERDHARLAQFAEVLRTGFPSSGERDKPAILLRNWLTNDSRNSNETAEVFIKTCAALRAFMGDRALSRLARPRTQAGARSIQYELPDLEAA